MDCSNTGLETPQALMSRVKQGTQTCSSGISILLWVELVPTQAHSRSQRDPQALLVKETRCCKAGLLVFANSTQNYLGRFKQSYPSHTQTNSVIIFEGGTQASVISETPQVILTCCQDRKADSANAPHPHYPSSIGRHHPPGNHDVLPLDIHLSKYNTTDSHFQLISLGLGWEP